MARQKEIIQAQKYPLLRDIPTFLYSLFSLIHFLCHPSLSFHIYCFILCCWVIFILLHYFILLSLLTFLLFSPEVVNYFITLAEVSIVILFTLKITSESTTTLLHTFAIKPYLFVSCKRNLFPFLSEIVDVGCRKQCNQIALNSTF